MKAEKKVIGSLEKCYALTTFNYEGKDHLVVAAEKANPCYAFDFDGNLTDTIWEGPGGVMTLVQYPGKEILMATQLFLSPNDSAKAKIVYYQKIDGQWVCNVLCDLPFVHRFGLLQRNGVWYIVGCTLKSAHAFKDDFTCPGRIWAAELPENITDYNADNQLKLTPIKSSLFRNHGFQKCQENGYDFAVVGADDGAFKVVPPAEKGGEWTVEQLIDCKVSDMLYCDFDGDGERELLVLSPFHGNDLTIYKKDGDAWKVVYHHEKDLPFLHAIWCQEIEGKMYGFIGNRRNDFDFFAIYYDAETGAYKTDMLDMGAGATNCLYYNNNGDHMLLAANRETDEIAVYKLTV